ncbi:hypothetical protein HN419_07450 [Candidatus Woesearchaeota archaeon]|jgi:hypothetical protein|nr:hypothetical protein [Candidatus Woesearchaeota archaeon]MBT3538329.1 hypothetical protein [Candidatus Woesearchaeota archaeon]MBT4698306.1 hypothetical protein [Candidatus Woesearchaeota archaeon]MBT4716795.1 hypothetical protein [Candidatus Woesearchaeota archaeon]MBT7105998.1 hypothetical protein [Candidatus Woesearchaeota archaeon]
MNRKRSQLRTAKPTQRTVTRKPAVRKSVSKTKKVESPFNIAPMDKAFQTLEGRMLRDIKELAYDLEKMNHVVFQHHVNSMKNDFSKWMGEVLGEKELSKLVHKMQDKDQITIAILKHIVTKLEKKKIK